MDTYTDDELEETYNNILEQLSKHPKCSNYILTKSQLDKAISTKEIINSPTVFLRCSSSPDTSKLYTLKNINIYEFVLDKLKKYKIVGVKTGNYGKIITKMGTGNMATENHDTNIYIIFINIYGECYCNSTTEYNWETFQKGENGVGYAIVDWFLELFIKPFAITPRYLSAIKYHLIFHFNKTYYERQWMPYIDNIKYKNMDEPKYKQPIESNKIIPKNIINDIINGKIIDLHYTKTMDIDINNWIQNEINDEKIELSILNEGYGIIIEKKLILKIIDKDLYVLENYKRK